MCPSAAACLHHHVQIQLDSVYNSKAEAVIQRIISLQSLKPQMSYCCFAGEMNEWQQEVFLDSIADVVKTATVDISYHNVI